MVSINMVNPASRPFLREGTGYIKLAKVARALPVLRVSWSIEHTAAATGRDVPAGEPPNLLCDKIAAER